MTNINKIYMTRLILGLVAGFVISQVLINIFFTSGSGVAPGNLTSIGRKAQTFLAGLGGIFKRSPDTRSSQVRQEIITQAQQGGLIPVAAGIYQNQNAAQAFSYTRYNTNEVAWVTHTIMLSDGREIYANCPVGQTPPSASLFED